MQKRHRKNNIYTKSYLRKNLIDAGFFVTDLVNYTDEIRKWTLLINGVILLTCCKKDSQNFWFRITGRNDCNIRADTLSSKILINLINEMLQLDDE